QLRIEIFQIIERTPRDVENCAARRKRPNGVIIDVRKRLRSGPGISGELMNRGKSNSLIVRHNRLGPVPMMPIKIPNGNPFSPVFERVESSDSLVAEIIDTL